MQYRHPRFWIEVLLLGLVLVAGIAVLTATLESPWANIARILWIGVLFGTYSLYYERQWGQRDRR